MVKKKRREGENSLAHSFVLDTLRAFGRQGIDIEAVIRNKLDGKYLPLPACADAAGNAAGDSAASASATAARSMSSNVHDKTSSSIDFHSSVHSSATAFKLRTLATRLRVLPQREIMGRKEKQARRRRRFRRGLTEIYTYAKAQRVLGEAWKQYALEALPAELTEARRQKLIGLSLNLTGCHARISRAKCENYVGLEGIVACFTARMLQIITPNNAIRWVPRDGTVLCVKVADRLWEVARPPTVTSIAKKK